MPRICCLLLPGLLLMPSSADATRDRHTPAFRKTYQPYLKPYSKNPCPVCHTAALGGSAFDPKLNRYGEAFKRKKSLTPDEVKAVESQDSDSDGWTNVEEIHAGTSPGNPRSHPTGPPPEREPQPSQETVQ